MNRSVSSKLRMYFLSDYLLTILVTLKLSMGKRKGGLIFPFLSSVSLKSLNLKEEKAFCLYCLLDLCSILHADLSNLSQSSIIVMIQQTTAHLLSLVDKEINL